MLVSNGLVCTLYVSENLRGLRETLLHGAKIALRMYVERTNYPAAKIVVGLAHSQPNHGSAIALVYIKLINFKKPAPDEFLGVISCGCQAG